MPPTTCSIPRRSISRTMRRCIWNRVATRERRSAENTNGFLTSPASMSSMSWLSRKLSPIRIIGTWKPSS